MNKMMLIAALLMTGTMAHADGFKCETVDQDLLIQVYNQTDADLGTRNAAVMVVSDPAIQYGNRTIARFQAGQTLTSSSSTYLANVDLRYNDSGRRGENIVGTKLGQLKTIKLAVGFSYDRPVPAGTRLGGILSWVKRDGTYGSTRVLCARYLKN